MIPSSARRGTTRRHAANRLFLEITLVMIMMILLSYAPTTSRTAFTETVVTSDKTSQGQAAAGRELWLHLTASGALKIKNTTDKGLQDWSAIQAHLEKQAISVVVIDPDQDVPFSILSHVWQQAAQSGLIVRIATKK